MSTWRRGKLTNTGDLELELELVPELTNAAFVLMYCRTSRIVWALALFGSTIFKVTRVGPTVLLALVAWLFSIATNLR